MTGWWALGETGHRAAGWAWGRGWGQEVRATGHPSATGQEAAAPAPDPGSAETGETAGATDQEGVEAWVEAWATVTGVAAEGGMPPEGTEGGGGEGRGGLGAGGCVCGSGSCARLRDTRGREGGEGFVNVACG